MTVTSSRFLAHFGVTVTKQKKLALEEHAAPQKNVGKFCGYSEERQKIGAQLMQAGDLS